MPERKRNIMAYLQFYREMATLGGDPCRVYNPPEKRELTDEDITAMNRQLYEMEILETVKMLSEIGKPSESNQGADV